VTAAELIARGYRVGEARTAAAEMRFENEIGCVRHNVKLRLLTEDYQREIQQLKFHLALEEALHMHWKQRAEESCASE
jgi:hypothetical protein